MIQTLNDIYSLSFFLFLFFLKKKGFRAPGRTPGRVKKLFLSGRSSAFTSWSVLLSLPLAAPENLTSLDLLTSGSPLIADSCIQAMSATVGNDGCCTPSQPRVRSVGPRGCATWAWVEVPIHHNTYAHHPDAPRPVATCRPAGLGEAG